MIYGILTGNGEHIDVSRSEKGAKRYATMHGYKTVSRRNENHYYVSIVAEKKDGKWQNVAQF